jgi:AcrR family transcriptional regulator
VAIQRMIDAAITVMSRKGYSGTTLAEIGDEAGYSRGLAHHHFGSKLELMRAVVAEMNVRFRRSVVQPPPAGQCGLDAVLGFVNAYLGHVARSGPDRSRTVFILLFESLAVAPELRPVVADMSATTRSHISDRIAQGIADGTIRPDLDPEVEAVLIAGMLRGATHEWMLDPTCIDLEVAAAEIQAMLRSRLAAL